MSNSVQMGRRRALVIANPIAGRGRGEAAARELERELVARDWVVELYLTERAGDASRRASQVDGDTAVLISVGGDGTFSEVLAGLDPALGIKVGMLPLGTANVLSLDFGLPREAPAAAEVFDRGNTAALDVARVDGRLSFLCVGIGPDAVVVQRVAERRRGAISKLSYVRAATSLLMGRPVPLEVELDGELLPRPYYQVLASNLIHYGGVFRLGAERILGDGRFEVYLLRKGSLWALLGFALRGLFGKLPGGSCEMRRAGRIRVGAPQPVACQVDGDAAGSTPVEIVVTEQHYRLLVP